MARVSKKEQNKWFTHTHTNTKIQIGCTFPFFTKNPLSSIPLAQTLTVAPTFPLTCMRLQQVKKNSTLDFSLICIYHLIDRHYISFVPSNFNFLPFFSAQSHNCWFRFFFFFSHHSRLYSFFAAAGDGRSGGWLVGGYVDHGFLFLLVLFTFFSVAGLTFTVSVQIILKKNLIQKKGKTLFAIQLGSLKWNRFILWL